MMKPILVWSLLVTSAAPAVAELKDLVINETVRGAELRIPVRSSGKALMSATWQDKNGHNVLVLSRNEKSGKDSVQLFADHWIAPASSGPFARLWKMRDGVEECPVDQDVNFIGRPRVEDLDQDGEAETTVIYTLTCRGDVSPASAKLIMHEGKTKYAIRGESAYATPPGEPGEGTMAIDPAFDKVPKLRDFAVKLWRDEVMTQKL